MEVYLKWNDIICRVNELKRILTHGNDIKKVYGIPRGGAIISGLLHCSTLVPVDDIGKCDIIVDDLFDSGSTFEKYSKYKKPIYCLIDKRIEYKNKWVVFPWETKNETEQEPEDYLIRVLEHFNWDKKRAQDLMDNVLRSHKC